MNRSHRFLSACAHGRWWIVVPWIVAAVVGVRMAGGQSLLEDPTPFVTPTPAPAAQQPPAPAAPNPAQASQPAPAPSASAPHPSEPGRQTSGAHGGLASYSLFVVNAPQPKAWAKHDLVEVIINETSIQKFQQVNDLKKNYDNQVTLSQFPSLEALFTELALKNGIGASKPAIGLTNDNKYKGDAKIDRQDTITAKITAEVIDVKPNGTLVLEAKESLQTDRELSTMVLSGSCRSEDITKSNTIQSSQVAGLNIRIEHEGDVKNTAEKGLIPRVLEAIFNF